MDACRLLEPAAEGTREALPDPEVHHQAGQEAARSQSRTHRCSGRNSEFIIQNSKYLFDEQNQFPGALKKRPSEGRGKFDIHIAPCLHLYFKV